MTTAAGIVESAHREGNLISPGDSLPTPEATEGLALLNNILTAVPGFNAGRELVEVNVGGTFDQSECLAYYVPGDVRLVLDLTGARTFKLHPQPYDGQRLAVVDAGNNLATNNLTLDGYGRRIEAGSSVTLSTNGTSRQWIYRADLGEWVVLAPLASGDDMPFPQEFDDFFSLLLWARIAPRNERQLDSASAAVLTERESQMRARYRKPRPQQDWGSLGLLGQRRGFFGSSAAAFNVGRTW